MMIRRSTLIWSALAVGVGIGLYFAKHEVRDLEERLEVLHGAISQQRENIHVLEAEWAYLNRPERLAELGSRLLELQPVAASRIVTLDAFPPAPAAAPARPDNRKMPATAGDRRSWARAIMAELERPQ